METNYSQTLKDQNVLVVDWYIKDTWYGQNYRCILSVDSNTGFNSSKEVKYYQSMFLHYVKVKHNQKRTGKQLQFDKMSKFEGYIYRSFGPSTSYTHYHITVAELMDWYKLNPKKLVKDLSSDEKRNLKEIEEIEKIKAENEEQRIKDHRDYYIQFH